MPNNIINASSSGSGGLITTAADSGSLELQSDGTTIATLSSTGLTMAAGKLLAPTGPAFRVYRNGNQTISAATTTKVAFNAESFDTNSNFDSTTNYRFTPTVAGYYQINSIICFTTGAGQLTIFKNGSMYQTGLEVTYNASMGGHIPISDLIYLNGSTDYVEIYVYLTTGTTIAAGETNTSFSGSLVRSA
jgi:hypothetical protein